MQPVLSRAQMFLYSHKKDAMTTDAERFDAATSSVRIAAEMLLTEFYGERCPEYHLHCTCCQKWAMLDSLLANPFTATGRRYPQYNTFTTNPVDKTIPSPDGAINVDIAADGSIVGVEIL